MKHRLILDKNRRNLFKINEVKRLSLKISGRSKIKLQLSSIVKLSSLIKNSTLSRIKNCCFISGRSRSVYKKLNVSRIKFKEFILSGLKPGFTAISW